jgi:beta-phosphoglucomutase
MVNGLLREESNRMTTDPQRLAVIFDVDGVLVDSYRAHLESWQRVAASYGLRMSEADFAATFGRTSPDIIRTLWGDRGFADEQVAEFDERKEAEYRRILAEDFPAMPGAAELVDALAESGFVLAAGSSGPPANVELSLEKLGRRERFRAEVTGRDVTRGKPDPQVFQIAAERLGVAPRFCAVIEDAPAGVAAAKRARMAAIGLASTGRSREELSDADLTVSSLRELTPAILRELIVGAGASD